MNSNFDQSPTHSRSTSPGLNTWDSISSGPIAKKFQSIFPLDIESRRQPWTDFMDINEMESAYIVGEDMRLLGGRVNAHSS